jgi:Fanconi anemia group M protein
MAKVLIFVDNREAASGILEYFGQYECNVESKMLLCGDYIVSDRICIERKTTDDFVQSIIDRRLFDQIKNMKDNFEKPVIVIEGNSLYGRLQPNAIRGAIASVVIDYGVPIIWTKDPADTAGMIYWLAKREQIDERREISIKNRKTPKTIEEIQEYLVAGLPDISVVRARNLLKHFKYPEKIFTATEEELKKVEGVGMKIAKRIRDLLTNEYKSKKSR